MYVYVKEYHYEYAFAEKSSPSDNKRIWIENTLAELLKKNVLFSCSSLSSLASRQLWKHSSLIPVFTALLSI